VRRPHRIGFVFEVLDQLIAELLLELRVGHRFLAAGEEYRHRLENGRQMESRTGPARKARGDGEGLLGHARPVERYQDAPPKLVSFFRG
jgi:hypothetical protein